VPLETIAVPARVLVAAVFLIGAIGKAHVSKRFAAELERYSVPRPLRQPTAVAIVTIEMGVGAALLWGSPLAQFAALAATTALVVLTGAAGFRFLLRSDRGDCMCFGDLLHERLSWLSLARNVALAVTSLFLAGGQMANLFAAPIDRLLPGALIATACLLAYAQTVRILGLESTTETSTMPPVRARTGVARASR
jgi:hypothetical protein